MSPGKHLTVYQGQLCQSMSTCLEGRTTFLCQKYLNHHSLISFVKYTAQETNQQFEFIDGNFSFLLDVTFFFNEPRVQKQIYLYYDNCCNQNKEYHVVDKKLRITTKWFKSICVYVNEIGQNQQNRGYILLYKLGIHYRLLLSNQLNKKMFFFNDKSRLLKFRDTQQKIKILKTMNRLIELKQQFFCMLGKIQGKVDWKKIDEHESLTFLSKNYQKRPSDIAKVIIFLIGVILFSVEGFNILRIMMCYLLPIGIMILKISRAIKKEKQTKRQQKTNDKHQNSVSLCIKIPEKDQQVSELASQNLQQKIQAEKSQQKQKTGKTQKLECSQPFQNQLVSKFILYFIINLFLDLIQPILLLFIQTLFNLLDIVVFSISQLIFETNLWPLLFFPFQLIGKFILHIITFQEATKFAVFSLISLRIIIAAVLLDLDKKKQRFCERLLYEKSLSQIYLKISKLSKLKKE